MCLAQGHNAVAPVRLEPTAPQSRVKHSTIELPIKYMLITGNDKKLGRSVVSSQRQNYPACCRSTLYFSTETDVMSTQKNHLNKTALLGSPKLGFDKVFRK